MEYSPRVGLFQFKNNAIDYNSDGLSAILSEIFVTSSSLEADTGIREVGPLKSDTPRASL
jgi:hypothetical protein